MLPVPDVDGEIEVAHAAPVPDAKLCAAPVPAVNVRFPGSPPRAMRADGRGRETRRDHLPGGDSSRPSTSSASPPARARSCGSSPPGRATSASTRAIRGIDLPLHAEPARYREAVAFLKADPLSRGALVTTHKLDLFAAGRDLFDEVDPLAALMAETSCLSKRDGRLIAHAKDPISSGLAIDGFLAPDHFARTGAEALRMGAGGSTIAITWHLAGARGADRPAPDRRHESQPDGWTHIRAIHQRSAAASPSTTCSRRAPPTTTPARRPAPGSLVVNATGLGKDAPGSPLTDAALSRSAASPGTSTTAATSSS